MSLLQSYEMRDIDFQKQVFGHYKGKPHGSGLNINPDRMLVLNYIDVVSWLPGSNFEKMVQRMLEAERTFCGIDSVSGVPTSLSASKTPRTPMNWSAELLYPTGTIQDYLASGFESRMETMAKSSTGILSWQINLRLQYQYYGHVPPGETKPFVRGYVFADIEASVSATTDFELQSQNTDVLLEGLCLNPNPSTIYARVQKNEDASGSPTYTYNWTFGVA